MKHLAIAIALTTLAAGSAFADETYVGAGIGARTHYGLDCAAGQSCDRLGSASGKVYFGTTLGPRFGVEGVAIRLGNATGLVNTDTGPATGRVRSESLGAVGVARYTQDAWTVKGRLGVALSHGKVDYSAGGHASKTALVPLVGLGASYAIDKNWSVNLDWDRLSSRVSSTGRASADLFSVGLSHAF